MYRVNYEKAINEFTEVLNMMRKFVNDIRHIHGSFYDGYNKLKRYIKMVVFLKLPFGRKVYIIGTPEHSNLGDSAIVISEKYFLTKWGLSSKRIKEITFEEYTNNRKYIRSLINKNHLICHVGGGNMGNQWIKEEYFHRMLIEDFKFNQQIIFPQTIFYDDSSKGKMEMNNSISIYNKKNLTIAARERTSYEIMCSIYPKANIILVPDIVLYAGVKAFSVLNDSFEKEGVLLCFRDDVEKEMSDADQSHVRDFLIKNDYKFTNTDMHANVKVTKLNRSELVKNKIEEFLRSQVVVTDRLHGMILSAITGTPCIVFGNYNHKIKGTYEFIKNLGYVKYIENINDFDDVFFKMAHLKNCKYDNGFLIPYYQELSRCVKNWMSNS